MDDDIYTVSGSDLRAEHVENIHTVFLEQHTLIALDDLLSLNARTSSASHPPG